MKNTTVNFAVLLLTVLFISCGGNGTKKAESLDASDYTTQSANGLYEVDVPNYMKSASTLNMDASMQYQNIYKETYLAVIDEDKSDFIDVFKELGQYDESKSVAANYREIQMEYFTETMEVIGKSRSKNIKVGELDAEQVQFTGRVPDVDYDVFYIITFIEGQDHVYMMMKWTLTEFEDQFKDTFLQMADSFKEL